MAIVRKGRRGAKSGKGRTDGRTNGRAVASGTWKGRRGTDENAVRIAGENRAEEGLNERANQERERERNRPGEGKRKNENVREKTSEPVDLESGVNARGVVNFPIVPFPTMPAAHSRREKLRMPGRHARPPEMARPLIRRAVPCRARSPRRTAPHRTLPHRVGSPRCGDR